MLEMTAFVLAGGRSTRMGTDKAFVQVGGHSLLQRALDLARAVTPEVRIVGAREKFSRYADTVEDIFPGRGPLGGIHAALSSSTSNLNLIVAVDTPFLEPGFLKYLAAEALRMPALVTVPFIAARLHPLCAVYQREFRARAEASLNAGLNKIDPLFTPAETHLITDEDLVRLGFPASMFDNLNTQEELQRAGGYPGQVNRQ